MDELLGITFVFENCEILFLPMKYIELFRVEQAQFSFNKYNNNVFHSGFNTENVLFKFDKKKLNERDEKILELFPSMNEEIEKDTIFCIEGDKQVSTRLFRHTDITSIYFYAQLSSNFVLSDFLLLSDIEHCSEESEGFYVQWGENDYCNEYQHLIETDSAYYIIITKNEDFLTEYKSKIENNYI